MAEACFRFAIEYVRYYEDAMYFDIMGFRPTFNQFVSVGLLLLGLAIYLIQRRRGALSSEIVGRPEPASKRPTNKKL
jgi:prolipoprotein diacylglyceryltransferase